MLTVIVKSTEELAVAEVPEPVPAVGQALIDVDAIGAGYLDIAAQRGEPPTPLAPGAAPGWDVVGHVTAVGPDTPAGLIGAQVLALLPALGGFAEKVIVDVGELLPALGSIGAAENIATGGNALVADIALHRAGLTVGDRVLVLGASGGIGVLATQIAHARGAEVTAVTSSAARGERLQALGASRVVNRTLSALSDYETYDVIIDVVAGPTLEKHLQLLRPNGHYIACGGVTGFPGPEAFAPLLYNAQKSPTLTVFSLDSVTSQERRQSWDRITALVTEGQLVPIVAETFPLTQADEALRWIADGKPFGKVVLLPR
ncbi:quinone oxidoreductase family protein [Streptomyces umbrinus]|uniref:quinone oxidoreductase family protein n=1 Tax=Streptomyces umbrinus TaxID=67370 RepID=UPI003C2AC77C